LRSRNYRFFFVGQGISLIGSWLTRIAMSWLVYRLTNSALLLGVVGFSSQILTFVFTPLAGVLVDRWERRGILLIAQIGLMVHAFTLAALTFLGIIEVWHIIALSVLQGLFVAFDTPSRQSFVVDMVERREDVPNAIALNSAVFQGARFIGPSVGGVLIALSNEGVCFLIDGISYIAVIIALLLMHIPKKILQEKNLRVTDELVDGFHYAFSSLPIRAILLLIVVASLFGMPYATLMPIVAKEILGGGPQTLGFIRSRSNGCGVTSCIAKKCARARKIYSARGNAFWVRINCRVSLHEFVSLDGLFVSRFVWRALVSCIIKYHFANDCR
jgi:MFS family permease